MTAETKTAVEAYMHAESAHGRIGRLDKTVQTIQHRPPVWATAAISLLTFFLGSTVTVIAVLVQ